MGSLYSEELTWLHRWPAGLKLLLIALLGAGLFALHSLRIMAAVALLLLLVFVSLGTASKPVRRLVWVALVAGALVGGLHVLLGNPALGATTALRLLCVALLGAMLSLTTRFGDILSVIEWLLSPLARLGVPTGRLALQLGLMLRFTEHFFVQWKRLDEAHRVRTGRAGGFRILGPLTLRMLASARRVADALAARLGW